MKQLILSDNWKMHKCGSDKYYSLSVPGSVYSTLLDNNEIIHPHIKMNENSVMDFADGDYEFITEIDISEDFLLCEQLDLVCEGLDTVCDVFVNDSKLGYFCNMHAKYRLPVKQYLQPGKNTVKIAFYSPLDYIAKKTKEYKLWENIYGIEGFSHIRKAHYMFGWDWGPAVPDIGIWKDIYFEGYNTARLESVYITQNHSGGSVEINIEPETVIHSTGGKLEYKITVTDPENNSKTVISDGKCNINIENPKLWYPNEYGEQPLYNVKIGLISNGIEIDSKSYTIGLRTIELINKNDDYGKSFYFRVNGIDIFAKGANYIPEDNFLNNRREKAEELLKSCKEAHFNMIRVWGGGIYQDDEFYKRCSEYGILVWQDFMYACASCKYDDELEESMTAEVSTQLKRLRNYPCFAIWAGNNEVEEMLDYGSTDNAKILDERNRRLTNERTDYIKMFHGLIPKLMHKLHPQGIYTTSSPTSDECFYDPNNTDIGDVHFWKVWNDLMPFSEYKKHLLRFCSEFGFQSIPCIETLKTVADEDDFNISSPVMDFHQKLYYGNNKIMYHLAENFRYPYSFEHLIYVSQVMQGESIGTCVEHMRSNRGICMGSLYWQLNDCWPGITWSSIDYCGRWKALHYFAKRFYAPVLVTASYDDGELQFALSNDTKDEIDGTVFWRLADLDGNTLFKGSAKCKTAPYSAQKTAKEALPKHFDKDSCYIEYSLTVNNKAECERILLFGENKRYSFKKADIKYEIGKDEKGIFILIRSDCLARYVCLSADENNIRFDDNFFDLLPGKERKIYVLNSDNREKIKSTLKVVTLSDTY